MICTQGVEQVKSALNLGGFKFNPEGLKLNQGGLKFISDEFKNFKSG